MQLQSKYTWAVVGIVIAGSAAPSPAAPITFNASSGNLAASATFDVVAGKLQITLINTSMSDVLIPADVLTGVFFDIVGVNPVLAPSTAILGLGSSVVFGGTDPGNVIGGEWAYAASLSGAPNGATRGISSAGLGLFGNGNFPGSNLQGPSGTNGLQYGITSAGDNTATGNTPVTGSNALIKNSVVFTLSGIGGGFDPSAVIGNVSFQYGTALSEPNIPEPATAAMLALGGISVFRRRRTLMVR